MMRFLLVTITAFTLVSCLETVEPDDVIGLRVNSGATSIFADNNSTEKLTAYIDINADKDKRTIKIVTTAGVFAENNEKEITVTAEDTVKIGERAYLSAEVTLKSSNIISEEVTVKATIKAYSASVNFTFDQSVPSDLTLSSDKFGVINSYESEAKFTASVVSTTGFPSGGYSVTFQVYDNSDTSEFTDALFREEMLSVNSQGQSSVLFTAGNLMKGDSSFVGDLLVVAIVDENTHANDSLLLNVSPNTN